MEINKMRDPTEFVRIAIGMSDGSTALMAFVTRGASPTLPYGAKGLADGSWSRAPSDANIFAELTKTFPATDHNGVALPQPVAYVVVDEAALPADRTYRNALRLDGERLSFDVAHATALHLDEIRHARVRAFAPLDAAWMRALAQLKTAEAAEIERQRQVLRDLPQTLARSLETVTTLEELRALWPEQLARG
jgi:hypothetical protein